MDEKFNTGIEFLDESRSIKNANPINQKITHHKYARLRRKRDIKYRRQS